CPSFAGTVESEIVERITKNDDPYKEKKLDAIKKAKRVFPKLEKWVRGGGSDYERFRRALKLAVAGNALEMSAPNYSVNMKGLHEEMKRIIGSGLAVDHTRKIFEKVKKAHGVLYLCDNCGEAVFDVPLIREIKRYADVTIGVSSEPMDEDLSIKEAKAVGLDKIAPVVGKGRSYGVWKKTSPKSFWNKLEGTGLVIAKGMANYETLDEYGGLAKGRTALLFLVKCPVVGANLRLKEGSLVAKMI
ncbi:MAG: ARMT1-like domain-containing protein, partial [Candidatus Micrarchaeota archaeon]